MIAKKEILALTGIMIIVATAFVMAQDSGLQDTIINQSVIDQVDFTTLDLDYNFNHIELTTNLDGRWILRGGFNYLDLRPVGYETDNITRRYEIQYKTTWFETESGEFLDCVIPIDSNHTACFNTHILPGWTSDFLRHDSLQRRKLGSYQTGGTPMLDPALVHLLE